MKTDTARAVHTPLRTPDVGGVESWEAQVHCRGPLAYLWDDSLDGEFESPQARRTRHRKAAQVCATCPAQSACGVAATQTPRAEGIWAGTLIGGSRPLMVPGRPCLRCERPLLPGKSHKPLPAGWVRHSAHGYCHPCLKNYYRAGAPGVSAFELRLRIALAESFTPGAVDAIMASKLRIPGYPGAKSRTVAEHVADGDGERLIDWAWSLTGMVAT